MKFFLMLIVAGSLVGCGVRGRPLPPVEPPYIGEGRLQKVEPSEDPNMPPLLGAEAEDDEEDDEVEAEKRKSN